MLPVVIVHKGYKDYLKYNLEITSQNNKIYLIGDNSLKPLESFENVNFIEINKYLSNNKIKLFSNNFTNYSTNTKEYELFCFLRILIIKLFMEEYKLEKVFHLDSDNILFYNIANYPFEKEIAYQFGYNKNKFSMTDSIHNGLINMDFCKQFEKLYEQIYITKEKHSYIEDKIDYHANKKIGGGICDMTFYYIMRKNKLVDVQDLCKPKIINGKKYIFIDNVSNGSDVESKHKYVTSNNYILIKKDENNQPYVTNRKTKEKYYIFNIHFQGKSKELLNQNLINNLKNKNTEKVLPYTNIFYILIFISLIIVILYLAIKFSKYKIIV